MGLLEKLRARLALWLAMAFWRRAYVAGLHRELHLTRMERDRLRAALEAARTGSEN